MCLPVLSPSDKAEPEERVLRGRDNVYLEPWMKKKEVLSALQKIVSGMPSRSLKGAGARIGCKGKSFADQSRKKVDFACIYIVEVPMSRGGCGEGNPAHTSYSPQRSPTSIGNAGGVRFLVRTEQGQSVEGRE